MGQGDRAGRCAALRFAETIDPAKTAVAGVTGPGQRSAPTGPVQASRPLSAASLTRIGTFWEQVFGQDEWRAPSRVVSAHRGPLTGYAGVYVVVRQGRVRVSAPEDLVGRLAALEPGVSVAGDPTWWQTVLPGWQILGPSVHAFLEVPPAPGDSGRTAPAQAVDLAQLRDAVSAEEWEESGFAESPSRAWIVKDTGNQVVAAANLARFAGVDSDVGVLTSARARGAGWGELVARHASREAVLEHGLARWRSLTANHASRRLAHRLGFQDDCLQLAVRPSSTATNEGDSQTVTGRRG